MTVVDTVVDSGGLGMLPGIIEPGAEPVGGDQRVISLSRQRSDAVEILGQRAFPCGIDFVADERHTRKVIGGTLGACPDRTMCTDGPASPAGR